MALLDPTILFFIFGIFAGLIKSNLEIPQQITKFLSLYLLMALGLKGGFALASSGLTVGIFSVLGIAVFLSIIVPIIGYVIIRKVVGSYDAAAVAATYGSVSAVTFVTATQVLGSLSITFDGFMPVALALMESPAIIMAVALAAWIRSQKSNNSSISIKSVLHESFTDGAHILLLGALVIGIISGAPGAVIMKPFIGDLFKGLLAFFLLDMGIQVSKNFKEIKGKSSFLLGYAIVAPLVHASIALALCMLFGVALGNTILLMVLAASASYIAVPAVVRHAIPEANPSLYFGLSLGITFPFNILVGIPLYISVGSLLI